MKNIYIFLLLLSMPYAGKSAARPEPSRFKHLSTQQGLSNNFISSICQDQEGFMWFGTADGLNKFDGYQFISFQFDPEASNTTLQHTIVTDVHEDRTGRIWVTTMGGGLHQVDKRTGKVTAYNNHPGLSYYWNVHFNLYENREGILWLGTPLGLLRFDPQTKAFSRYPMERVNHVIGEDSDGQLLIEVKSRGQLFRFNPNNGQFTLIHFILPKLYSSPKVWRRAASGRQFALPYQAGKPVSPYAFLLDSKGTLWIGTEGNGLFRVKPEGDTLTPEPYNPNDLVHQTIYESGLFEDSAGFLWASSPDGLQQIDRKTHQVTTFVSNPAEPGSLSSNDVRAVFRDRTGTVWLGTDNGIDQVLAHPKPFQLYPTHLPPTPVRLPEYNFQTILEDHTGTIWMGSLQKGLFRWEASAQKLQHIAANPQDPGSLSSEGVSTIFEDHTGTLWVNTKEALHKLDRASGKFIRYPTQIPAMSIDEDKEGNLWIAGSVGLKGAIARFSPVTEQFQYYTRDVIQPESEAKLSPNSTLNHFLVLDILVSRSDDIWVATARGINRLNPITGNFRYYQADSTFSHGHLTDNWVRALYEDEQGIVWIGTNHGGLNRFDPRTETFSFFTIKDGMPANQVVSIAGDNQGNLWIGTDRGISRFNPITKTFRNFDVRDGLPDDECNLGSVYSRNGRLLFGTVNGAVGFQAEQILENTVIPPVHLTGLKVQEKSLPIPAERLELPYHQNFLSFEFVALNYDAPEKNQYAFRLEGLDKDWIYSGNRRFASYTDLRPGHYTFRVKASNNDGIWNQTGTSLTIIILPPWWLTPGAYLIYAMVFVGLVLAARKHLINRERLKNELRFERLASEKLQEIDALKSRFFANLSHEFRTPLSLIRGTVEKLQTEANTKAIHDSDYQLIDRQAGHLLEMINQLLDLSKLEAGKLALNPQPRNLSSFLSDLARSFVALFESRKLVYRYTVPMQPVWVAMDQAQLERILSNLLTNAAKFTEAGGEVQFSASIKFSGNNSIWLKIVVQDTGIGILSDQLPHIFDRFYQADSSSTRTYEGTGIGLALVKELVELHQGSIAVESMVGKGSTFTVMLPLSMVTADKTEQTSSQLQVTMPAVAANESEYIFDGSGPLLLIIEDNADLRHFIRDCFSKKYKVLEAANGTEGQQQALESLPDLIISDIMMPGINGLTLCHTLKTDERTSHIPIVLLTAKADMESKVEGLQNGADEYLIKPFHGQELQMRVKNLLDTRKKLRERYSKQLSVQPQEITVTSTDEKFLQKVFSILESHISDSEFDVTAFSQEIGISQTHLHRKLTALLGQTANELIRSFRLKRAASLLVQQHGNVSEIAYQVGFTSPNYFTKCFKDYFGQTPSEYILRHSSAPVDK